MKVTLYNVHTNGQATEEREIEIPDEICNAAKLLSSWMQENTGSNWQFFDCCARSYAYKLEIVRIKFKELENRLATINELSDEIGE